MDDESTLKRARSYILWLLSRRDYPRRQLEEKLRKRELSPTEIKKLLDEMVEEGWYRENTFKKLRTRQLLRRGDGPSLVKAKMSRDRIVPSKEEIVEAYAELETSPEKQIQMLVEKYTRRYAVRELDPRQLKQKLVQAIMRKGYNVGEILQVLNKDPLSQ